MSQGVLGWRTKVTGLGLVAGLVLLSGATCLPPGLDPTGGTTTPAGQTSPTTLSVLSPLSDTTISAGTTIQVAWTSFTDGNGGQLKVFYDTDTNANNGVHNLVLIDLGNPTAPSRYNWDTTGVPSGTYYVGAQLNDGTNTINAYAQGRVIITGTTATKQYSLDELGSTAFRGCVFEGFSFAGNLGTTMAGRFDMLSAGGAPDGVSDFILVAPLADSHYSEDPGVGEAYLFWGWDSRLTGRTAGWYNGARFSVNSVGSDPNIPGAILVGPSYITSTLGIAAVQPLADVDGDRGAELMFGMPLIINGRFEDQDYDPCDTDGLLYGNAPLARPNPSTALDPDDHDWYGGLVWSSGYITILSSTTVNLYNPASNLGGVVHIDEIGQVDAEHDQRGQDPGMHPRTIDCAIGLRVYPYAREGRFADFLKNDYRFGAALGIEDIDGDGTPEWLVAEPKGTNNAGDVAVSFTSQATLWTSPLPGTATSYSWPYMSNILCPAGDRLPVWPFGILDYLWGDEMGAPNGQLSNPTGIGDFNNDGLGDIAVSTPHYSAGGIKPDAGAAYMVFGRAPFGDHYVSEIKAPVVQNALPGLYIQGTTAGDLLGTQMTALGRPNWGMVGHPRLRDFNADGLPDWVISAPGRSVPGKNQVGAIAIIWGSSRLDGRFTWDQITTGEVPGIIITGANQGDRFGQYMVEAGDVNGDGSDDLVVVAPGGENPMTGVQDAGAIYIIYGPPALGAGLTQYQGLTGTYKIDDLLANGPIKVRAIYGSMQGHQIGPVAGAGDINNDGYEDILIADPLASPLGRTDAGEVYLIFGSAY